MDFIKAGGKIYESDVYKARVMHSLGPKNGWLYGETPWGSVIEMVTFKEA